MIHTRGYVNVAEAAQRLHLSPEQVRRRLRCGKLRGQRIGKQWFVEERALETAGSEKEFVPLIPPELADRIDRRREKILRRNGVVFDVVRLLHEDRESH